ncbi:MAG: NADH-quinone oxidoreductase subunit L [Syntrophobacterales bacterium]|jgi:NADH-quinone oxidoreductase subunit L|nr:NADH-quinone oxidoreductase subunit L [Syntrophobacterales bacterium]
MMDYVWLIPLFPLIGFFINGLLGKSLPKGVVGTIGASAVGLSFLLTVAIFLELLKLPADARSVEKVVYTWIASGPFQVSVAYLIDPLSMIMLLVVSGVSTLIHIYSIGYMADDEGFYRYFAYLNLFVFAMLTLVSANNFLLMFVGWEGVGLCSYLLIGFWYEKKSASDAGKKAFVVNRIGDFGFLLGAFLIFWTFGSLDFKDVFAQAAKYPMGSGVLTAITLCLFLGATGKSAQIPLYTWLPDAMEGPTPVSALIHAATMVTAGVFMVARCSTMFVLAPVSLTVVAGVGALTAIYAATIGITQFDIKRVLAYSTVSQLGYMFLACGVGAFTSGIFHLMTHAFFKALLFLGSGSVIHGMHGEQDMRKMGGLKKYMPITYWTFMLATLAIAGIFPFAGFFSKDEILFHSLVSGHYVFWGIATVAAFITAFYMFRAVFMTFNGEEKFDHHHVHPHESPSLMTVPLMALAGLSVVGGLVGFPIIKGANKFKEFLAPSITPLVHEVHAPAWFEITMMAFSMAVAIAGIYMAYKFYMQRPELPEKVVEKIPVIYDLVYHKYYIDEVYDATVVEPLKNGSDFLWHKVDENVIDGTVNGSATIVSWLSNHIRKLETGYVQNYALGILIGAVLVTGYLIGR